MDNDLYSVIIKKQQEIINLMIQAGMDNNSMSPQFNFAQTQNSSENATTHQTTYSNYDKDKFAKWLAERGMSHNSIDTYTRGIEIFFHKYKELNAETLKKYEKSLNEYKPKTKNLRIAGMYKYFKFIGFSNYEFKRAKEQKRTFCDNAINLQQYNKLMGWAEINNPKAWLVCKVIANTGVRVSELISLRTADIYKGYVDITGKGSKNRRIYFSSSLIDAIKNKCGTEYIIENRYGQQMTTRGIDSIIKSAGKKAGIPIEVMHAHSFRHFFAKQFLKENDDITLLGDLLGHSDISTTAIYTRQTSEEQLKEINNIVNW